MRKRGKRTSAQTTIDLMGIDCITDYSVRTRMGDLVFFIIKPTNISVLPEASISARIYALLNVLKGQAEIEMLALNSRESFEDNKNFYRTRMDREFFLMVRLRNEEEGDVFPYLSRIEKHLKDNGFVASRAGEEELKRMLGVYFEQNVTTEHYEDTDGQRWLIVGE